MAEQKDPTAGETASWAEPLALDPTPPPGTAPAAVVPLSFLLGTLGVFVTAAACLGGMLWGAKAPHSMGNTLGLVGFVAFLPCALVAAIGWEKGYSPGRAEREKAALDAGLAQVDRQEIVGPEYVIPNVGLLEGAEKEVKGVGDLLLGRHALAYVYRYAPQQRSGVERVGWYVAAGPIVGALMDAVGRRREQTTAVQSARAAESARRAESSMPLYSRVTGDARSIVVPVRDIASVELSSDGVLTVNHAFERAKFAVGEQSADRFPRWLAGARVDLGLPPAGLRPLSHAAFTAWAASLETEPSPEAGEVLAALAGRASLQQSLARKLTAVTCRAIRMMGDPSPEVRQVRQYALGHQIDTQMKLAGKGALAFPAGVLALAWALVEAGGLDKPISGFGLAMGLGGLVIGGCGVLMLLISLPALFGLRSEASQ